ncbi:MAG: hypothetical protein KDD60_02500, partial [Bdellovibrionales bacterium]|nr:hypothetical protein [Bdellovibrionales bacterium]
MKLFVRISLFGLLLSGALYAASLRYIDRFPPTHEMLTNLENEPVQEPIDLGPFTFEYRGSEYMVRPRYAYELWGLVVSQNDISSITDSYHNSDSVDFKDLCVVWGENLDANLLNRMQFWSEPWTCFGKPKDGAAQREFSWTQLSNNHILSRREEVRSLLSDVHRGDQIQLKGMLVDYADKRYPSNFRRTSTVRTDTGNGACEVFFVEAAKVLKVANPAWRQVYKVSRAG